MGVSKYSNAFKQKALLQELDIKVAQIKRENYKKVVNTYYADNEGVVFYSVPSTQWEKMLAPYRNGFNLIDCADRINESKYRKCKKVRDKISHLVLTDHAIFITLTFTDKVLSKTSVLTRRRYVARYLKQNCKEYVANIDFGALNGREHYHAVVSQDIDLSMWRKYGAIKVERVRPLEDSTTRVARYITKLTNHALKVGAVSPRLIYSRLSY